jgi:hypothetical protein
MLFRSEWMTTGTNSVSSQLARAKATPQQLQRFQSDPGSGLRGRLRSRCALAEGHRFGNFKPSFETVAAIKEVMAAHGVTIPAPMAPIPVKGYGL